MVVSLRISIQDINISCQFNRFCFPRDIMAYYNRRNNNFQSVEVCQAWKAKILKNTVIIDSTKKSIEIVQRLMETTEEKIVLSLDCEGVNLGRYNGQVTLVQIGTKDGEAYLFDVRKCPSLIHKGKLKDLLESKTIIKVIHDCQNDSANLFEQFGVVLENIFDTQIAHKVLESQKTGKPVYNIRREGLNALCQIYDSEINPLKDNLKNIYRYNRSYWAKRPMTEDMIIYASSDIFPLVPKMYNTMTRLMTARSVKVCKELCEAQVQKQIKREMYGRQR